MNKLSHTFGPQRRVKKRNDFLRIQSKGKKLRSKHFLLIVADAKGNEAQAAASRIGITITTKIDKRAVKRNKLKRRIREIFRQANLGVRIPIDYVFIGLTGATELGFEDVEKEISYLLRSAKRHFDGKGNERHKPKRTN